MTTLKTDFVDGDILHVGVITDSDKLNGITNTINNINKIHELYTGTDFNSYQNGSSGTNEGNYETTQILASELVGVDYIKIKIIGYAYIIVGGSYHTGTVKIKLQEKYIGGTYTDILPYQTVFKSSIDNDASGNSYSHQPASLVNLEFIYELNNDDKANGIQLQLFSSSTTDYNNHTAGFTNIQTVISLFK